MRTYNKVCRATVRAALVCFAVPAALAQNYMPPSPLPAGGGLASPNAYSLNQIESVNPVTGDLSLSIPLAQLPPGPGGFTASVNLRYNSAFYTLMTDTDASGYLRQQYGNDGAGEWGALDGGWSYGFKYELWSAQVKPAMDGWSMYFTTADGRHHLLLLAATLNPDGTPGPSVATLNTRYPNRPVYDVRFDGACANTDCRFHGTLVYATVDNTFIRVESNTETKTWVAQLPDGTRVSGNFEPGGGTIGEILAAEWNTITDRNGNTLQITHFCVESSTCTTTLTDQQGRTISIQYGSVNNFPTTWQDTIVQPGINGNTTTVINWSLWDFNGPSYDCVYKGPGQFDTCSLSGPNRTVVDPLIVTSVQMPSASTNGPSAVYLFTYDLPAPSRVWGELHSLTRRTLASGADLTPCLNGIEGSCPKHYSVNYSYYFDDPATNRVMGTLVNPISSRVLTYTETREGAAPAEISETTAYSVPVPTTFSPTTPPPVGGVSTITHPDQTVTQIYSKAICTSSASALCSAVVYTVVHPDNTMTEMAWTSNTAPPGAPAGGVVNPYVRYAVQTVGSRAKGTSFTQDANGNATSAGEYDWFDASTVNRSNGVITGIPGSAARTTSTEYYSDALAPEYWMHAAPAYLRATSSVSVGNAWTEFNYDAALSTANLIEEKRWDSANGVYITRGWTYAGNGNLTTATDPNSVVTKVTYDAGNLYPTKVEAAFGRTEKRTTTVAYDGNTGLLLNSADVENGITTTYTYDNLGRQTGVTESGSGGLLRSGSTHYDDLNRSVTRTQDQTQLTATTHYDGLGRARLATDAAGSKAESAYRVETGVSYELVSNPYTSTTDATMGWTLTTRDAMGRVVSVRNYKGADPPAPWGTNTTITGTVATTHNVAAAGCTGPATDVTNQDGQTRRYCPDGLGRLRSVHGAGHECHRIQL